MEPSDSDIKVQLLISPPERWQLLWSAADDLLAEQPSPWEIRTQNADGSTCMPYAVYSEAVNRVERALYEVDAIVGFDWTQWDGLQRYRGGRELAAAPVADACRVLTAITRAERFSDGTIGHALDDGTFQAALLRLRTWYDGIAKAHAEYVHPPQDQSWISRRVGGFRMFQALLRN
ncbi:DUF6508 domain-containing protein [Nocardia sp. CDC159]|uniref:DUF6508 domain-containing protein n=1 Tax=Nocardia pulmonis TaxID=2951408 RepID=A0A9X2E6W6_9NOCA|nr:MULTISPECIES: DUF6508 domain-containing protein [Nocardia]MCM6773925.1 DUF6508 domain-containing protein [Nocardia pulmonis]MCM6786812.1 DUF6508 domain-containing protein [Nocardia sp. CDC159]